MKRAATLVLVMLAMSATAAVDARALAREGRKTQWAPTRNFSTLNARAVFASESRRATSPYAGEDFKTAAAAKEAGFTGHRVESALGLSYAKRRWLDSSTGTWLSRDEVGAASYLQRPNELNPWLYAASNPTRFTDPDGRCLPGMGLAECVTFDTALVGSYAKRRQELGLKMGADIFVGPVRAAEELAKCATEPSRANCKAFRFTIGMDPSEKEELATLFAQSAGWEDFKTGLSDRDPVLMGRGFASMQYEFEQFANMVAGTAAGALGELPVAPPVRAQTPVPSVSPVPAAPINRSLLLQRRIRLTAGGVNNPSKAAKAIRSRVQLDESIAAAKPSAAQTSTPHQQLTGIDDLVEAAKPSSTNPPTPNPRLDAPELPFEGSYRPAPKELPGFPGLKQATRKTPVQGGGGLRRRWVDGEGNIYEWDSQHGTVEKYNSRGVHQGEFDPNTGRETKPADKMRRVEP